MQTEVTAYAVILCHYKFECHTHPSDIIMDQNWSERCQGDDQQSAESDPPVYQVLQPAPFMDSGGVLNPGGGIEVLFSATDTDQPKARQTECFSCQICGKAYNSKSELWRHSQTHNVPATSDKSLETSCPKRVSNSAKFCCELCGKTYTTSSNLYKHTRTHRGITYKCRSCPKTFRYQETLKRHEQSHLSNTNRKKAIPSSFACPLCQEVLPSKLRLGIHLRSHPFEKAYKCDVCERTFSQQAGCIRHRLTHSKNKDHSCVLCKREFASRESLRAHLKTHSANKPFSCEECDKTFTLKCTLEEHKKLHAKTKTHKCQFCGKSFRQRSTLWGHEKLHKRHKLLKCAKCEECFATSRDLSKHEKVHWKDSCSQTNADSVEIAKTSRRPRCFSCQKCGENFAQKSVLQTHMRRHTGEKPFQCKPCGKLFRHRASYRRHSMIHFGIKPFKCQECSKTFTKKSYLDLHLQKSHQPTYVISPKKHEASDSGKSNSDGTSRGNATSITSPSSRFESSENSSQSAIKRHTTEKAGELQHEPKVNCCMLNGQSSSHDLESVESPVDPGSDFPDRVIVSFQDVFDVPINEECVQTMNLLEHVMELTQIAQGDLDKDLPVLEEREVNIQNDKPSVDIRMHSTEGEHNEQNIPKKVRAVDITNTLGKPLICEICGRMYKSHASLQRHIRAHTCPQLYKCDLCCKSYSRRPLLHEHVNFAHSEQAKTHTCIHCKQAFPSAARLALHARVHTGHKPFECRKCHRAFADRSNLLRHERTHEGVRSHQCPECDALFVEKSTLTRHVKRHRGEHRFPCSKCNKSFVSKADLQCHSHVHRPAREPVCPLCGLKFQREIRFRQHQAQSKGVARKCRVCGECCPSYCIRRQHEVQEHSFLISDAVYSCGVCNVDFIKKSKAIAHIRDHVTRSRIDASTPNIDK